MAALLQADSELLALLHQLRETNTTLAARKAQLEAAITLLHQEHHFANSRLEDLRTQLIEDLRGWVKGRRDGLRTRKSLDTIHGRLGVRATPPKAQFLKGQDFTAKVLRARGLTDCFVMREEISIDALRRLPPSELRQAGVSFEAGERLYVVLPDGTHINLDTGTEPESGEAGGTP